MNTLIYDKLRDKLFPLIVEVERVKNAARDMYNAADGTCEGDPALYKYEAGLTDDLYMTLSHAEGILMQLHDEFNPNGGTTNYYRRYWEEPLKTDDFLKIDSHETENAIQPSTRLH